MLTSDTNTSLRVLHFAGSSSPRVIEGLPSWVSDSTASNRGTNLGDITGPIGYRASGSTLGNANANATSGCLFLKGNLLDTLEMCVPQLYAHLEADTIEYASALLGWIEKINTLIDLSPRYNGRKGDVLWRSLIGNMARMAPASDEYGESFQTWLSYYRLLAEHGDDYLISFMMID